MLKIDQRLIQCQQIFGDGDEFRIYFAPGRLNLIGEHIDYNGGHVLPVAITNGTYILARKRSDRKLRFYSCNFKSGESEPIVERDLDRLVPEKKDSWTNYPCGVIKQFLELGYQIDTGLDIYIYGNIPGSGLSSSASFEVATAVMLKDLFNIDITKKRIALLCQKAEHNFCKTNCGVMDQFASIFGKASNAVYLDCATLDYHYVPIDLQGYKIVVTDSNVPHNLAASKYNERRAQCQRALFMLSTKLNVDALCAISIEDFERYKYLITDTDSRNRAQHAIYEEKRVKDSLVALKNNDIMTFAKLINESNDSLRDLYDASCPQVNKLIEIARKQPGVIGARLVGGGWGGNIMTIVPTENVDAFTREIAAEYRMQTKLKCISQTLEIGNGGRRMEVEDFFDAKKEMYKQKALDAKAQEEEAGKKESNE